MSQHNNQKVLKSILKKYLEKIATQHECDAINSWYEELGNEASETRYNHPSHQTSNLGQLIKSNVLKQTLAPKKIKLTWQYIKYAAIFFLIIGVGFSFYQKNPNKLSGAEIAYKSSPDAAKEITLKDGSVILLNVGSELIVAKDFGTHERNVTLKGEGFFKIAKDKNKPFIITSGPLKTKVLGTSFNINAYADLGRIKIAVASGKVMVTKKTAIGEKMLATSITKNTSLTFNKSTGKTTLKTEDTALISSWKESKLYIDNATLSEIAKQLERYYHLKVVYNAKLDKGKRYTIRFNGEPANRVMEILSILTKTKFAYQTNQITIK